MFSMCGLLCRFLRGWRQNEAVGLMVHAASLKDASLQVENISNMSRNISSLPEDENKSLFCQSFCVTVEEQRNQLLWRDNNKQAILVSPKERVDLVKWTGFLSASPSNKELKNGSSVNHTSDDASLPQRTTPYASRKNSTCSDCENIITVLLEASFREKEEETLYGYNVLVEQLAEPYAWKSSEIFGIIIHTTPTKLVTMIHAFFNNALIIDEDLCIRKIITVDILGEPSSFENPSTVSETLAPKALSNVSEALNISEPLNVSESLNVSEPLNDSEPSNIGESSNISDPPIEIKLEKENSIPSPGPDEVSFSNPNLEPVGSALIRGMPLSSSFTASPYKRPLSSAGSGISPIKRGISNQGKNTTSPGCDSCPASPLFEEEEDFECLKAETDESRPPNIHVYASNNEEYFESVKETLMNTLSKDSYTIYHLTDDAAFKSPWKLHTTLLVLCGDVPTHVSTMFIRYLLSGGQVLSICSDFLNVAVPLFGTVEVQEASVVSMSYNKWKNVQLLHHQHCFHSSPKHKRFSRDLEKKSSTGSAVSVEPTFVEITDEYAVRHRLNLKVLAKDDTWGAPSLLVANVSENKGKALFSQVHLEKDPNKSISCELKGEQLKKSNESRLEILRDLLSTYLGLQTSKPSEEELRELNADYAIAYLMGRHEVKQKFMEDVKQHLNEGRLDRHGLSISFHSKEDQCSIPSQSFLPVLLAGYTKAFSTVKYFEELKTLNIGRLVIFCEVLSSTQNVIAGKTPLEHGTAVIAMQQKSGKGRHGNMWLSPLGCAMFSVQLHIPLASNMGQCLPFLQHLIALSAVTGVTRIPGYEGIPLRIKWPNDIYLGSQTKIGGLIVEASISGERVIANVGCGLNLWNGKPTSCINDAIKEYNATEKKQLSELSREILCANIFNQMEKLLHQFQENGAEDVIKEYYKFWLHGNARVSVKNEMGQTQVATVVGIDQFGYLKAELGSGEEIVLHPDGNSFNMMEGLIYSKVTKSS